MHGNKQICNFNSVLSGSLLFIPGLCFFKVLILNAFPTGLIIVFHFYINVVVYAFFITYEIVIQNIHEFYFIFFYLFRFHSCHGKLC